MCEAASLDENTCVGFITFERRVNAACRVAQHAIEQVQEALAPTVQLAWRVQRLRQVWRDDRIGEHRQKANGKLLKWPCNKACAVLPRLNDQNGMPENGNERS